MEEIPLKQTRSSVTVRPSGEETRPRFFYGWVIVWLSFVTLAFHTNARFSFGIFQVPLIAEFGWGRGTLAGAYAFLMAIYALSGPFVGSLFERHGPRAVMPWGSVIIGVAVAASFFVDSLWHVYFLTGMLLPIGNSMSGFSMHSALMPRWFSAKRGLATGIVLAGTGIGALVLAPTVERLIAHFAWRGAYLIYGLTVLLVLAPANFLLLRDRARDVGQGLDGSPLEEGEAEERPEPGAKSRGVLQVFRTVKGDRRFWALGFIPFVIGMNNNAVVTQLQLYLVDAEYGMAGAAMVLGMVGFFRVAGSVVTGWVSDRLGRRRSEAFSSAVTAIGVILLMAIPRLGSAPLPGYLFAVVFGLGTGGMSTCFSAMVGDCFRGSSLAVIMGLLGMFYGLGGTLGPPMAGFAYDFTGSYVAAFSFLVLALLAVIVVSLFLFSPKEFGEDGEESS